MFDSNTCCKSMPVLGLLAILSCSANAQTSTTSTALTLAAGAWSSSIQASINGKDSTVLLQQVQMDLAQSLPAGMRETAVAALNTKLNRVRATTCISAQTAAAISTPQALFASLSQMNPRCKLIAGRLTASTQYFTGYCADPMAFTGNISGKVYIESPSSWRGTFSGTGQVPDAVLQALSLPPGTAVQMQSSSQSRWASATCPTTGTTVASVP